MGIRPFDEANGHSKSYLVLGNGKGSPQFQKRAPETDKKAEDRKCGDAPPGYPKPVRNSENLPVQGQKASLDRINNAEKHDNVDRIELHIQSSVVRLGWLITQAQVVELGLIFDGDKYLIGDGEHEEEDQGKDVEVVIPVNFSILDPVDSKSTDR